MDERLLPAQRRFLIECAGMAILALCWLACLVLGVGGQQTTHAMALDALAHAAAARGDQPGRHGCWRRRTALHGQVRHTLDDADRFDARVAREAPLRR
jgi:hypothetical protein